jgi:aminocarboxymuconate-semialdehyde decarboxylase
MAIAGNDRKAVEASELKMGLGKMCWGCDAPFFPPLQSESEESSMESPMWRSVTENLNAINSVSSFDAEDRAAIRGTNAMKIFQFW